VPLNIKATVTVQGAEITCWHDACRAKTRILTGINVAFGPEDCRFTVSEIGKHPKLLRAVLSHLPRNLNIGEVKRRFSKTQGRAYVSNGCVGCDRLQGEFFEHDVCDVEEQLCRFPITLSEQWRHAIVNRDGFEPSWGVYPHTDYRAITERRGRR
jgi:hypothetical protein